MDKLFEIYDYYAKSEHGRWIMSPQNSRLLYDFVKKNEVKKILDLGTGIGLSASICALALKNKGREGTIDSLEQYDKCVKIAKELLPEKFKKNVNIIKQDIEIWSIPEIPYQYFNNFKGIENWDYDLIINDGPGPFIEDNRYIELPNGTILRATMEDKIKPGTFVLFDGRISALKLLERYFANCYVRVNPVHINGFNVIQRNDNKAEFIDEKPINMKELGYFKGLKKEEQIKL